MSLQPLTRRTDPLRRSGRSLAAATRRPASPDPQQDAAKPSVVEPGHGRRSCRATGLAGRPLSRKASLVDALVVLDDPGLAVAIQQRDQHVEVELLAELQHPQLVGAG